MKKILLHTSVMISILLINGCSVKNKYYGGGSSSNASSVGKKASKATMRPYTVAGIRYYPRKVSVGDSFTGIASWYGPNFHGKLTSNGETYNMHGMTAAHKTLPMNTILRVTNLTNHKSVVLRINDRGPFVDDRIIDLSKTAATRLDVLAHGTTRVRLDVLGNDTTIPYNIGKSNHIRNVSKINRNVPTPTVINKPAPLTVTTYQKNNLYVQIGSYGEHSKALRIQQEFDEQHAGSTAVVKKDSSRDIYKVIVGKFKTIEDAREFINTGEFPGAYVVRL